MQRTAVYISWFLVFADFLLIWLNSSFSSLGFVLNLSPSVSLNVTSNIQISVIIKELRIMERNRSPISFHRGKTEISLLYSLPELFLGVYISVHTKWNTDKSIPLKPFVPKMA